MYKMDGDACCLLKHVHDLCASITANLRSLSTVTCVEDAVASVRYATQQDAWNVVTRHKEAGFWTQSVVMATGAHPKSLNVHEAYAHVRVIPLEQTFKGASAIQQHVTAEDVVGVFGNSHSGMVVLRNLLEMAHGPRQVFSFAKAPPKYAVYKGDWILHDNTGLKGASATWARSVYENADAEPRLAKILLDASNGAAFADAMAQCTKVVYAVGYEPNPLPVIWVDDEKIAAVRILYDDRGTGQLYVLPPPPPPNSEEGGESASGTKLFLKGAFGIGIAFPQRVIDRFGNEEYAVGLYKFLNFLKRNTIS